MPSGLTLAEGTLNGCESKEEDREEETRCEEKDREALEALALLARA
jgi:hypothetical protein